MRININNQTIDLTPEQLERANVSFTLLHGRKFNIGDKNVSLNELLNAVTKVALKENHDKNELLEWKRVFEVLKEKGYRKTDQVKSNFCTIFIAKIKHLFSKATRNKLLSQLNQVVSNKKTAESETDQTNKKNVITQQELDTFTRQFQDLNKDVLNADFYDKTKKLCQKASPQLLCEALRSKDASGFFDREYISIVASFTDAKKLSEMVKSEINHSGMTKDYRLLAFFLTHELSSLQEKYSQELTAFCRSNDRVSGLMSALRELKKDEARGHLVPTIGSELGKMFPDRGFSLLFLG